MKKHNRKKESLKNNGFISIEALLVITVLMIFTFFIIDKVADKLEIFGDRELRKSRSVVEFSDYGESVDAYFEHSLE